MNPFTTEFWPIAKIQIALDSKVAFYNQLRPNDKKTNTGRNARRDIRDMKEAIKLKSK